MDKMLINKVLKLIGFNLIGKKFEINPMHFSYFITGNLVEFNGGLVEFSASEIPVVVARAIEKLVDLHKIYTIGINKDNNLLASVHFFTFKKQEITNRSFLETFVRQAGIVLQKKMAEDSLKESENKLIQLNRSKDKFFSILAHDLKSPFSGFLGLTRIMAEEIQSLTMRQMEEYARELQNSAGNLYKLLENLLEWSRMQRGVVDFKPEKCLLANLVKPNIDIVIERTKQKNIQLISKIDDHLEIIADIQMLNTVIRNLISNAIKFTPKGGMIEIGYIPANTMGTIFVKDSGIGMDSDTKSKLFRIDEKVSRPGTEGEPSTGLGLLLCKDFIEKQNGKIWVESEEGKGSTFYFTLPFGSQD